MPAKMAGSAPRPPSGLPEVLGHPHLASILQDGRNYAKIHASRGVMWGIPVNKFCMGRDLCPAAIARGLAEGLKNVMSKKGSYLGGHTVLTQSRGNYEAELARAAQRAKRRAKLDQERHDAERQRRLQKFDKTKPRRSRPVMATMSAEELRRKYPEGVPQWMLGHSADEIDHLMELWRKKVAKAKK